MVSPGPCGDRVQNQRIANLYHEFAGVCQQLNISYLIVFPVKKYILCG